MADELRLDGARCLVLGAGGFMGTNLCRALCDRGAEVQGFGRTITFPEEFDPRVHWVAGQFGDTTALAKAVQGQDFVFHLISGSIPGMPALGIAADFLDTTQATLALLEICRSEAVRKVVFASSGGTVYGVANSLPIAEDAPTDPISAYGIGKLAIEKFLALYRHEHGLDYQILRIANPYGPCQSPFRKQGIVAALLHRALTGRPFEIWGEGEVVRDYIAVSDVAEAFVRVLDYDGPHKIMNVGTGEGRSVRSVADDIRALLGAASLEETHRPARRADVPANILDAGLLRAATGWVPLVEWRDGLRHTAEWMQRVVLA